MKAVIYARYSSERQTEQSIEGQLRVCKEYAQQHDINIVATYIDRAISGKTDHREQFQQMIKDSDKKVFDAVIVYKMDRFARNRYDSAIYKTRLKKNCVKVLYAKECIPDGPEGIILESLLEGMAEYYSEELSQKIRRGLRESALKCKVTGGYLALGYKISEDKTFIIDEDEANIVRKIFNLYDSGVRIIDICKELNSLGVKTARGALFNKNSMHTILKNEKYIGVYKCTIKGDKENHEIRIEDGVPPIIEKDLFYRVQKRLEKNKKAPAKQKAKIDYLLSGKIYCGKCGSGMVGESGSGSHGKKYYYYTCVNKKRKKTCDKKPVKKDWIEDLVVNETTKNILYPDQMEYIAKKCVEIQNNFKEPNNEIELLKKQLSKIKKSIENLMSAIEQGIITKTTKSRLTELEKEQEKIEFEISMEKLKEPNLTEKQILYLLSQYQPNKFETKEDYNRSIIECFVNSVYLYDDKLYITYNVEDEDNNLISSTLELISKLKENDCHCIYNGKSSDLDTLAPPNRKPHELAFNRLFSGFVFIV